MITLDNAATLAAPAAALAASSAYIVMSNWPRLKIWRAWRKVRRTYGPVVADRFSAEQIVALAKYTGPMPPDLVTERDIERNRWAPMTDEERREIASGIILQEQLRRAVADPEGSGRVTYG